MTKCLLKGALPFTLTFIIGAAVGGFFKLSGGRAERGGPRATRTYTFEGRRHGCDYRRKLLAETKPPLILFKPDARIPKGLELGEHGIEPVTVAVTFGEDGKVREAHPQIMGRWLREVDEAAARAAREIRFIPAMRDGVPTTVREDVVIRFSFE